MLLGLFAFASGVIQGDIDPYSKVCKFPAMRILGLLYEDVSLKNLGFVSYNQE